MKIYDLHDSDGHLCAFEVSNTFLGRRRACAIAARVPGARVVRRPGLLSWSGDEVFCEFEIGEARFEISEPFGDSSRFWIGPVAPRTAPELAAVRVAFAHARPL